MVATWPSCADELFGAGDCGSEEETERLLNRHSFRHKPYRPDTHSEWGGEAGVWCGVVWVVWCE